MRDKDTADIYINIGKIKKEKNRETYILTGKRRRNEGQFEIEIPEVHAAQIPYFVSIVQENFRV